MDIVYTIFETIRVLAFQVLITLYCLDESGTVALLKWGNDGLETAGRFRLYSKRTRDAWAHPVLLDGQLYLRYHDTLWCYDVKK